MSTRSRRFVSVLALGLLVGAAGLLGRRAVSAPVPGAAGEAAFRAIYPAAAPVSGAFAGVDLSKVAVPGLRLTARDVHSVDEGGISLSYSDLAGEVRAVIKIAVARDAAAALRFVDQELHGIQAILVKAVDPALGDHVFADDAGRGDGTIVGSVANVAYAVHVMRDAASTLPRAAVVASGLRAAVVEGAPSFPTATVALPSTIPLAGAPFGLTVAPELELRLRAEGGYVAKGRVLRPFQAGPVTLVVTLTDELGRVSELRFPATAK